jgi:transposase
MQISTIGIDLAKTVFQIHAVDADGETVICKRLRRAEVLSFFAGLEPCLIGIEACATSHYWARELTKFGTDAEAICEAVDPAEHAVLSRSRAPAKKLFSCCTARGHC